MFIKTSALPSEERRACLMLAEGLTIFIKKGLNFLTTQEISVVCYFDLDKGSGFILGIMAPARPSYNSLILRQKFDTLPALARAASDAKLPRADRHYLSYRGPILSYARDKRANPSRRQVAGDLQRQSPTYRFFKKCSIGKILPHLFICIRVLKPSVAAISF